MSWTNRSEGNEYRSGFALITPRAPKSEMTEECNAAKTGKALNRSAERFNKKLAELDQFCEEFVNRFSSGRPGIPEFKSESDYRYHAHFRRIVEVRESDPRDFCAIYEFSGDCSGDMSSGAVIEDIASLKANDGLADDVKDSVFIPLPSFIKDIKRSGCPAVIKRLNSFDSCSRKIINAINHSPRLLWVLPLFPNDGETGIALGRVRNHLPNGVFKGGSYLAYDFTGEDAISDGEMFGHPVVGNDVFPRLKIIKEDQAVAICGLIASHLSLELFEMLLGPIDLGSCRVQRFDSHGHKPNYE